MYTPIYIGIYIHIYVPVCQIMYNQHKKWHNSHKKFSLKSAAGPAGAGWIRQDTPLYTPLYVCICPGMQAKIWCSRKIVKSCKWKQREICIVIWEGNVMEWTM